MGTSPPPTPTSRAEARKDTKEGEEVERRFHGQGALCEFIESYRPGGYHPVVLGDVFNDGQYKVIRKLGWGGSSTVWLARDSQNDRYVALKICVSEDLESTSEVNMLRHIAEVAPGKAGQYITQLLDEFHVQGPNGVHKCLVLELLGPDLNFMLDGMADLEPFMITSNRLTFHPEMSKSILKQSLQALAFLHENGIAHGDLNPGKMLFAVDNIDSKPEQALRQELSVEDESISSPIERRDGKEDKWSPPYLCFAQTLMRYTNYGDDFKLKLAGMNTAFFFHDPPAESMVPCALRPPELILTGAINETTDVWSFGCLLFELFAGSHLFFTPIFGKDRDLDDIHLLQCADYLGPLPDHLFKLWKNSSQYFTAEGEPIEPLTASIEEMLEESDLDDEEIDQVAALIRWILQYDPELRPSPAEILAHPWFQAIEVRGDRGSRGGQAGNEESGGLS